MSLLLNAIHREFRLDDWLVQPAECRLSKGGLTKQIRPKVMDLLTYVAERPGEVISKDQLLDGVWGGESVSESALTRTVTELRQALGDDADEPHLLETIPKRGYRLIGTVSVVASHDTGTGSPVSTRTDVRTGRVFGDVVPARGEAFVTRVWARNSSPLPVRIAVLPFDHIGQDRYGLDLADGLVEDTIVSLGMIDPAHLVVVGRTSTRCYRATTKSVMEIGRELAVDYLVEGAVRIEEQRLRVTWTLVRARDAAAVCLQSYDRNVGGVLGWQGEVSVAIAEQVRSSISSGTRPSKRRHTRSLARAHGALWFRIAGAVMSRCSLGRSRIKPPRPASSA